MADKQYVSNQVFVGYSWKRIRNMFERRIKYLHQHYPLHFKAMGREYEQSATDLCEEIKRQIGKSSAAIFDVTGGSPNVALEFGYAEALEIDIALTLNERKPRKHVKLRGLELPVAIISDLRGKRVNFYRSQPTLDMFLLRYTKQHPYARSFKTMCREHNITDFGKKVLLYVIRLFDSREVIRRDELVQKILSQFPALNRKVPQKKSRRYKWIDFTMEVMPQYKLISISRGRYSQVRI